MSICFRFPRSQGGDFSFLMDYVSAYREFPHFCKNKIERQCLIIRYLIMSIFDVEENIDRPLREF